MVLGEIWDWLFLDAVSEGIQALSVSGPGVQLALICVPSAGGAEGAVGASPGCSRVHCGAPSESLLILRLSVFGELRLGWFMLLLSFLVHALSAWVVLVLSSQVV